MASYTSQPLHPVRHFLLLAILVLSSNALGKGVLARCIKEHHDSLLLFKGSLKFTHFFGDPLQQNFTTEFPDDSKLASWKAGTDCCTWAGVTCGKIGLSPGHVTQLDLSHSSLYGNIHPALFNLTSLRSIELSDNNFVNVSLQGSVFQKLEKLIKLDLSSCGFVGELPAGISRLTNLEYLDLSSNGFVGDMSGVISRLTNLVFVDLSDNFYYNSRGRWDELTVTNILDLESIFINLRRLQVLHLRHCRLSRPIPDSIGQLKQLTELDLADNFLSGHVPTSIANLTQLNKLDLSTNRISGSLPIFIPSASISHILLGNNMLTGSIPLLYSELSNLTSLSLHNNSLTGLIPMSLFNHPTLEYIDLANNKLGGFQGGLSSKSSVLRYVHLSENKLQGPFPHIFFTMPRLQVLYINENKFTGVVDLCSFKSLRNLSELELSGNLLTVNSSECEFFLPRFEYLSLRSCNITKVPKLLQGQHGLWGLDLSRNQIEGVVPYWIWNTSNPLGAVLNLSYNFLVGFQRTVHGLSRSTYLKVYLQSNRLEGPLPLPPTHSQSVVYSDNNLTGSIPVNIGSYIKEATYFSFSRNKLTGEIPPSICDATHLEILELSHNKLSGTLPSCLANMSRLTTLNIQGNMFTGTIPPEFNHQCALVALNMNGNMLHGRVPSELSSCKTLQLLDIGNNKLMDAFPFWLGKLPDLKVLILKNNKFYGSLPKMWNGTFTNLRILDLSVNQFFGSLPSDMFRNLRAMKRKHDLIMPTFMKRALSSYEVYYHEYYQDFVTISAKGIQLEFTWTLTIYNFFDLSSNRFGGLIPSDIGELIFLKVLNLSSNNFLGYIPQSLGLLTQLESMDLSRNMISGRIPLELLSLKYLSVLNLSYNQLEGEIPQGSQFSTFPWSTYIGNKQLCGPPTAHNCLQKDHKHNFQSYGKSPKELNWKLISMEVGFISGMVLWFTFLMFSSKSRTWLNLLISTCKTYCSCTY